jgi:ABC-type branched-subunit amino acid transport system substrate-binding protein
MKTTYSRLLAALMLITLALTLPGCRVIEVAKVFGIISAGSESSSAGVQSLGQEQNIAYEFFITDGEDVSKFASRSESAQSDEVQVAVRELVEDDKVLALVGATSNEATMRAASLVNFFNLPMIIPTAGGDNLLPSNNLWAFRLSAPGSSYAVYTIDTLLSIATNREESERISTIADMKIAILYEANTFGESAAVAAAQAALRKEKRVAAYRSFPPDNPDPERLRSIAEEAKNQGAQVVVLISSSPSVASQLIIAIGRVYGDGKKPLLVGLAGGFASYEFLSSDQAGDIFVVRQQLVRAGCPAEIQSIYSAQTFAALSMMDETAKLVQQNLPEVKQFALLSTLDNDPVIEFRENLRNELKLFNQDVPCIGRVAFDNAGQLKDPQFELVYMQDGAECVCAEEEFQARLQTIGR